MWYTRLDYLGLGESSQEVLSVTLERKWKVFFFYQSSVNGEQNENVGIRVIAKLVSVWLIAGWWGKSDNAESSLRASGW